MKWKRCRCSASALKVAMEDWKRESKKDARGGIWNIFGGCGYERVNAVQVGEDERTGSERISEMSEKVVSRCRARGSWASEGS